MRFKIENVELARINADKRDYRISTGEATSGLRDSLDRLGLLNPPTVLPEDDRFVVVSGFKRVEAARDLGREKIPCRILPADASPRLCARIAIADNSMQRSLDIVETSRALALLKSLFDEAELPEEAQRLGLPANRRRIDEIEPLCRLSSLVLKGMLSDSIAAPVALELSKTTEKEAVAFAELFLASNCSLNKQREIVRLVKEISRRDDRAVIDVLLDDHLQDILRNPDSDKNGKTREIRSHLRKIRYPNIAEAETNFAENIQRLRMSQGLKLIPPQDFEGSTYCFTLFFKNSEELSKRIEELRQIARSPELNRIVE